MMGRNKGSAQRARTLKKLFLHHLAVSTEPAVMSEPVTKEHYERASRKLCYFKYDFDKLCANTGVRKQHGSTSFNR
jgi:hypothetical protein